MALIKKLRAKKLSLTKNMNLKKNQKMIVQNDKVIGETE